MAGCISSVSAPYLAVIGTGGRSAWEVGRQGVEIGGEADVVLGLRMKGATPHYPYTVYMYAFMALSGTTLTFSPVYGGL
jgi:hypothetical protein